MQANKTVWGIWCRDNEQTGLYLFILEKLYFN